MLRKIVKRFLDHGIHEFVVELKKKEGRIIATCSEIEGEEILSEAKQDFSDIQFMHFDGSPIQAKRIKHVCPNEAIFLVPVEVHPGIDCGFYICYGESKKE